MSVAQDRIRNFSIVAHIDHGKSTLADRILEQTQSVALRDMEDQLLDNMDLERERGITIKAHAVTLNYHAKDGQEYVFNLIDTPGHVDFNYEVSRSLAACEGAVLIVDASQGIEAQTLANTYLAVDAGLEIVPVINKIDLLSADPDRVAQEIEDVIGIPADDAPRISAKQGINIDQVMEKIVSDVPAPKGDPDAPLQALIFDSYYDAYRGVIVYVRIKEGRVHPGDVIRMMAVGSEFTVVECGYLRATSLEPTDELSAGEVGYIAASIKNVREARVGDTVTLANNPCSEALCPATGPPSPWCSAAYTPPTAPITATCGMRWKNCSSTTPLCRLNPKPPLPWALVSGAAFLGLLHMEIIQERLEREYNLDLITTAPSVVYHIEKTDGTVVAIDNPTNYPDPTGKSVRPKSPSANAHIYSPSEYVGSISGIVARNAGACTRT